MMSNSLLLGVLLVPLLGVLAIGLSASKPNVREALTLITGLSLFILVVAITRHALNTGVYLSLELVEILPGLSLTLAAESLGLLFALVASFLWIITSIYSIGYMRGNQEKNQTRFYICFAVAIASAMGIAFAANMFTLFIFYEVLTLSTYPLVTHAGTEKAKQAGRVYLGILLSTSIGLQLVAVIWTWHLTGTLDFTDGGVLAGVVSDEITLVLFVLYVFGMGKAALMPLHRWLPAAMVAPTPVSALLHAVAVVKAGVFSVLKVAVYIFGIDHLVATGAANWLLWVSGGTLLIASIIALTKDNLKARLAYSTISQLSYVILATAVLAPFSIMGAAIHIAAHAFGKITLFFAAGSIYTAAHKTKVSELNGIGRKMPWTMGAFAIGALSMIGLPPTAGFVSKWYILVGSFQAEQFLVVGVLVVSTLLNAAYLIPIVYRAFLLPPDDPAAHSRGIAESPFPAVLALTLTAAGTVLIFFFPEIPIELATKLAAAR